MQKEFPVWIQAFLEFWGFLDRLKNFWDAIDSWRRFLDDSTVSLDASISYIRYLDTEVPAGVSWIQAIPVGISWMDSSVSWMQSSAASVSWRCFLEAKDSCMSILDRIKRFLNYFSSVSWIYGNENYTWIYKGNTSITCMLSWMQVLLLGVYTMDSSVFWIKRFTLISVPSFTWFKRCWTFFKKREHRVKFFLWNNLLIIVFSFIYTIISSNPEAFLVWSTS